MERTDFRSPRFIISVNGEPRCTAGFDGYAVLAVGVVQMGRTLNRPAPDQEPAAGRMHETVRLTVGGLQRRDYSNWLGTCLTIDDEVTIRIEEGGPIDDTISRDQSFAEHLESYQKQLAHRQSGNPAPRRLAVSVNGEQICVAGATNGVAHTVIDWVRRDPARIPPFDRPEHDDDEGLVTLRVSGLEDEAFVTWLNASLDPGDEVAIKVLGEGPIDEVISRQTRPLIPYAKELVMGGGRLSLRRLIDDDLDFLCEMLGDPEVMRYWPAPYDRAGAQEWLRKQQQRYREDGCGYWLVVDNETHQPVGQAGVLMTVIEGETNRLPCIGYIIHRPFQRQGYGLEAAWSCMTWIEGHDHPRAYAPIRPENEPSLALARKLGMKPLRDIMYAGFAHVLYVKEFDESPPEE